MLDGWVVKLLHFHEIPALACCYHVRRCCNVSCVQSTRGRENLPARKPWPLQNLDARNGMILRLSNGRPARAVVALMQRLLPAVRNAHIKYVSHAAEILLQPMTSATRNVRLCMYATGGRHIHRTVTCVPPSKAGFTPHNRLSITCSCWHRSLLSSSPAPNKSLPESDSFLWLCIPV
jgi:hypothetical protein